MKHFFLLLLFLNGFLFQARLLAQSNVIDEIIWVIGDEAIFLSDVEKARRDIQMEGGRIQGDPYCVLPEEIAIRKLFLHQAKLDSIEVTDSQVLPEVDFYVNNYLRQVGSRERFEEYVNMPLNLYRDYLRESLKERHTIQQVQQKLVGNITVSPTEVRRFYNRIPQDSLPFIPTTVEVEIITQEPVISLDEIDEIRAKLRDYTEQVTSGRMQFSTLARMYSDNRETGADGGETGLLGRTSLTPEFAAAAFDLNDPQRISRIVEDEYGFHIIQLIEKRADRINVRHILLRPFVSREEIAASTQRLDSLRNDILDGKFTFEEAVYWVSADRNTRNNRGLMVNNSRANAMSFSTRTGTSRFEMSELPPEISTTINTMAVGEISKPFTMINSRNREIVAIVRLKSRTEGHVASLSEDFQTIRAMVEEEKQEAILDRWISRKISETYFRINDNWRNCDFQRNEWLQQQ